MRMSERDKQIFWYALYGETVEDVDEWGNYLGTYITYSKPVKTSGNISAAKGEVAIRQFGDDANYDRTILLGDSDTPIDEYAVIWIDKTPVLDENGALAVDARGNYISPWNYVVKRVARSLPGFESALIAVKMVERNVDGSRRRSYE